MKSVKTENAVGHILCHDITKIVPGEFKGAAFKKGHIVTESDIPELLKLGKEHLYVWEQDENYLHEDDAARLLDGRLRGENITASDTSEGKITWYAECDGLFKIRDIAALRAINSLGEIAVAARFGNFAVRRGDKLGAVRVIPLRIAKEKLARVESEALFSVKPFEQKRVAIIATGNEVLFGRVQDKFTPVVEQKLAEFSITAETKCKVGDDPHAISTAIKDQIDQGADIVICTGGMSVDPDDRTPLAIKNTKARIVTYGAPVLPGSMFMLAYYKNAAILGLPGCVMYSKRTVFDIVLPRLLAGDPVKAKEISAWGLGGLCLECENCVFPDCPFGKGVI